MVALPRPSQAFAVVTLVLLAGGQNVLRDLVLLILTGHLPAGINCIHVACY